MALAPTLSKLNPLNWRLESRASLKGGALANPNAKDIEDHWIHNLLLGAGSSSGINVTPKSALGVSTVYACVDVLASAVGSLPVQLYRKQADGSRELDTAHPIYELVHNCPNEEMTSLDFRQSMQAQLSLRKNAYAQIVRAQVDNRVLAIFPIETSDVTPRRDRLTGQIYYEVANGKGTKVLEADEVLHLRGASFDGICAPDMMHTVKNVIGLALALDQNAAAFFKNNSQPGGFLRHPSKLSKEAAERLIDQFSSTTSGASAYRLKLLEEGLEYVSSRTKNTESQMDESRDRQAKEIARLFRVPGHKVGIVGNQPRANVEQENLSFVIDTLLPILVNWEQALGQKLLTPAERAQGYYFEFNIAGMLRGSLKERYDAYAVARNWGWLSVNEIRRLENMNPIGDQGDVYLQPLNMQAAGTPAVQPSIAE